MEFYVMSNCLNLKNVFEFENQTIVVNRYEKEVGLKEFELIFFKPNLFTLNGSDFFKTKDLYLTQHFNSLKGNVFHFQFSLEDLQSFYQKNDLDFVDLKAFILSKAIS